MAAIRILVISNESDSIVARLVSALNTRDVDHVVEIKTVDAQVEATANHICTGNYDIVLIDKNVNAIDILSYCQSHPSKQKPRSFFIDGAIDQILDMAFLKSNYSGSIGIFKANDIILRKGYQCANRFENHVVPNSHDTIYNIGSMTKMMTGLAVTILATEKGFSFKVPMVNYVPEEYRCRNLFEDFTLHELLTHTSGLNIGRKFRGGIFGARMLTLETIEDFSPIFFPEIQKRVQRGGLQNYSNQGYWLLGLFVEAVAGVDYYNFVQDRILNPLEMKNTVPQRGTTSATFAIPYAGKPQIDSNVLECVRQLSGDSTYPELQAVVKRIESLLFVIAQYLVTDEYSRMKQFINEYEQGLLAAENFSEFKLRFSERLDAMHKFLYLQGNSGDFTYKYQDMINTIESLEKEITEWVKRNIKTTDEKTKAALQRIPFRTMLLIVEYPAAVFEAITINLSRGYPFGGWYSNIDDFKKFQKALFHPQGAFHQYAEAVTSGKVLIDPSKPGKKYGYGFVEEIENDKRLVFHSGGVSGARSEFRVYLDSGNNTDYVVIALANDDVLCNDMQIIINVGRFLSQNSFSNAPIRVEFLDSRVSRSQTPFISMLESIAYIASIKIIVDASEMYGFTSRAATTIPRPIAQTTDAKMLAQ